MHLILTAYVMVQMENIKIIAGDPLLLATMRKNY